MSRSLLNATFALLAIAMLAGCAGTATPTRSAGVTASSIEEEWGVRVIGIRSTAAGYMLDFRYRVLDAEKAAPILDRRIAPFVRVAKTGVRLLVPQAPKLGAMRQTSFAVKPDRDYFMIFVNPSQMVKVGDEVSVIVGDFQSGMLTVE